jgi:hypothetical protein
MTGIGIQMLFIILFSVFIGRFYLKMRRDNRPDRPVRRVKWLVWAMYAAFVLILVSTLYLASSFLSALLSHLSKLLRMENQ